jgi:hypothetical protein
MDILSPCNLKDICNTLMNMDPRVRFVGVLAKDAKLIEGGMRKEVSPLFPADKDDLFLPTHNFPPKRIKGSGEHSR